MTQVSERMQQGIQMMATCADMCQQTIAYCLQQGGRHVEASHLKLMMDCAEICRTASDFMARGSQFSSQVCVMCAQICDQCAESCASFAGDSTMEACADTCRRCASMCRQMAG